MATATHLPTGPNAVRAAFEAAVEQHADKPFSVPTATAHAYGIAAGDLNPKNLERELGSQ